MAQPNSEWKEICQWLQSLNYMCYSSSFKNEGYDMWDIVCDLGVDELTSIGIRPGHAKRIVKQLSMKQSNATNTKTKGNTNEAITKTKINQEIILAETLKNQLFQTMTSVVNGLQQEVIEMNVKFAQPMLALQRAITSEKSKEHLDGTECALLLDTLSQITNELKMANDKMWSNLNQFRNLAESHIHTATEQIQIGI
eukprot:471105_1